MHDQEGRSPAGWFPDPGDAARERYWDGTAWTDDNRPQPGPPRRAQWYFVAVLVCAIAGVLVWGLTRDDRNHTQPPASAAPVSVDTAAHVVYTLTGTAEQADITYSLGDSGTEQQSGIDVPMVNESSGLDGMRFDADPGAFLYFSAQNTGETGDLTCQITVDGEVVAEHTSSGGYSIVTCEGAA